MNSMKCFILHLPLFIFFLAGSARADGGDVLDRIVRLPGMKGTVYALLGKVSEQSGYLFIYDSKVIHNDSVVRVRKQECSVRQAIHRITGSRNLELKVLGYNIIYNSNMIVLFFISVSLQHFCRVCFCSEKKIMSLECHKSMISARQRKKSHFFWPANI